MRGKWQAMHEREEKPWARDKKIPNTTPAEARRARRKASWEPSPYGLPADEKGRPQTRSMPGLRAPERGRDSHQGVRRAYAALEERLGNYQGKGVNNCDLAGLGLKQYPGGREVLALWDQNPGFGTYAATVLAAVVDGQTTSPGSHKGYDSGSALLNQHTWNSEQHGKLTRESREGLEHLARVTKQVARLAPRKMRHLKYIEQRTAEEDAKREAARREPAMAY